MYLDFQSVDNETQSDIIYNDDYCDWSDAGCVA